MVTSKSDWKYLLEYEVDGHDESALHDVLSIFNRIETSWIAYKSLNGYHIVGLTPLNAQQWGYHFQRLQNLTPEYFSGQTLRISLKPDEKQEFIDMSLKTPYIQKLAGMYARRFKINEREMPVYGEMPNYSCVFEKYWTAKI